MRSVPSWGHALTRTSSTPDNLAMPEVLPRVVLAGRPNVGKSTLFNRLLGRRRAIVHASPGVTRDILEEEAIIAGTTVLLADSGGVTAEQLPFALEVRRRSTAALPGADVIVFVVDSTDITAEDQEFAEYLRRYSDRVVVAANKVDHDRREALAWEAAAFGFAPVVAVSAEHGIGIADLEEAILERIQLAHRQSAAAEPGESPGSDPDDAGQTVAPLRLAILGRPNTGKSTLLNRLVGEERSIVSEIAGTTRDSISAEFQFRDRQIRVVDTAGIRRKTRVHEDLEYYSVNRALAALDQSDVVLLMIDAVDGLSDQDKKLAGQAIQRGASFIFVLNKWDLVPEVGNAVQAHTDRLRFLFPGVDYAPVIPISARNDPDFAPLLSRVMELQSQATRSIETGPLNRALERWVLRTPPPQHRNRPVRIRYGVQTGTKPQRFRIYISRGRPLPEAYRRYLINSIRADFSLNQVPVMLDVNNGG